MPFKKKVINTCSIIKLIVLTAICAIRMTIKGQALMKRSVDADTITGQWAKKLLGTVDATVKIHNPHQVDLNPNTPTVIMSNHCSLFDIPISYAVFEHRLRMIAKKELFRIPCFGSAMRNARHISMDRSNPRMAIKNLKQAQQAIQDGVLLWVAPEGTRSSDGELQTFKSGGFKLALAAGANIIPMTIRGSHHILSKNSWLINRHQTIDVTIGQAISTDSFEGHEGLKALMQKVKASIEAPLIDAN